MSRPVVVSGVVSAGSPSAAEASGVAGVAVSDGATTVRTDVNGYYELSLDPTRRHTDLVFISCPPGYVPPTDECQTPRFHQLIEPDEAGHARADFTLIPEPRTAEQADPCFIALADVHVQAGTTNNAGRFTDQLADIGAYVESARQSTQEDPRFLIVAGDVTNFGTPEEFADYRSATARAPLTVWSAIGNHEYTPGDHYADRIDNYRRYLGPEWYSFTSGRKHFVVLDSNGGLQQDDQLAWLEEDLALHAPGREVVVVTHQPFNVPITAEPLAIPAYIELFERYDTVLLLAGHTHVNDVDDHVIHGARHVVTTSSSYTIDQTPNGFRVVTFDGPQPLLSFREYGAHRKITLVHPADGARVPDATTLIEVNAYDPSQRMRTARYRIDDGDWQDLQATGDRTWAAELDASALGVGGHRIEARVTDWNAGVHSVSAAFDVVPADDLEDPRQGTPWPMFHADAAHRGVAAENLEPPLRLAWTHLTNGTILTGSPVLSRGIVVIGVRDENGVETCGVVAIDLGTGEQRWRVPADSQVEATPAIAGDSVFVASIRGVLTVFDLKTGRQRWSHQLSGGGAGPGWAYASPTVDDGVLYQAYTAPGGLRTAALDIGSGAVRWESEPLGKAWLSAGSPALQHGLVFVPTQLGPLVALDARTGEQRWQAQPATGWMRSSPVVIDDLVLLAYPGDLLVALDAHTGTERWRYRSAGPSRVAGEGTSPAPATAGGKAYAAFGDGRLSAVELATGRACWHASTGDAIMSSPALSGDVLYAGSNDGYVHAFDAHTGQPLWRYELGPWVASSPAVSGNTLVVAAWDGNVYAFVPAGPGAKSAARWTRAEAVVVDAATQEPIPSARVVLTEHDGQVVTDLTTDIAGRYFAALPVGTYRVTASAPGFADRTVTLDVRPDSSAGPDRVGLTRIAG